ncbi:Clp protease ClpP [Cellulosilyticum sp. ST5]|uniref:head maturation protease, ClpP-related n=1 Tax=Cellulosilyticum sp. ST5 TaxID=3055805 RepID=UPI003977418B
MSKVIQFKNYTETSVDMYISGDISDDSWKGWSWGEDMDVYPSDIKTMLDNAKGKNINLYVNSGGGHISAGLAIAHMLQRHDGTVVGYVDAMACSIASVIMMACDEIHMPKDSYLMIHKPSSYCSGNADDMRKTADGLDTLQRGIMAAYERKLKDGVDIATVEALVNAETWLTAEEASNYFDIIIDDSMNAVACTSELLEKYMKTPKNLFKNSKKDEQISDEKRIKQLKNKIDIALALA